MSIDKVIDDLKNDPRNKSYTDKGIGPIFQVNERAKILIIGQAPGKKVQESGVSFTDKSGENLCDWLGIDMKELHSEDFAVLPMDFYYPGKAKSGDLPPRKFIADEYHKALLKEMPDIRLTILMGAYSQKFYLKKGFNKSLTKTVRNYKDYLPQYFPIPHSSPLNNIWQSKNPRFKEEVLPNLKKIVGEILKNKD